MHSAALLNSEFLLFTPGDRVQILAGCFLFRFNVEEYRRRRRRFRRKRGGGGDVNMKDTLCTAMEIHASFAGCAQTLTDATPPIGKIHTYFMTGWKHHLNLFGMMD